MKVSKRVGETFVKMFKCECGAVINTRYSQLKREVEISVDGVVVFGGGGPFLKFTFICPKCGSEVELEEGEIK